MPYQFFKDDDNKDSAFRVVFVPAAITLILLLGLMVALLLREVFSYGDNYEKLMGIFNKMLLGGGGLFGAKVLQKVAEVFKKIRQKREVSPSLPDTPPVPQVPKPKPPQQELPKELMIIQDRIYENDKKTLSLCQIWDGHKVLYSYVAIELPWRDNKQNISRIPANEYDCTATRKATPNPRTGEREYALFFPYVPGRSQIMLHIANYVTELEGCIGPGLTFSDIDNDGVIDVADSRKALIQFEKYFAIGTRFKYLIRDSFHLTGNTRPI